MKYVLLTLLGLISISTYADKKKSKTSNLSPKNTTTITNADGTVTTSTTLTKQENKTAPYVSKLAAMQPDADLFQFELQDFNGKVVNHQTIGESNLVVVLYNPDCGHCKDLGKEMYALFDQMKETKFLYLTGTNMKDYIPEYLLACDMDAQNPLYIFSTIDKDLTESIFDYNGIPQVMVYNKEKKLQRVYYQTVDWQEMKAILDK